MDDITSEYLRCSLDYVYFIENYLTTYDQTKKGNVPFKLFPIQQDILHNFKTERYNLALKYRQAGLSTITAAYVCWLLVFADEESPEKILIVANKRDTAGLMLKKINEFLQQCPDWMFDVNKKDILSGKDSEFHKVLYNKSEVKAVATSMDALRGYTPTLMIIDEAAHIDNIDVEEFWSASMAALSTGGRAILISCVVKDTFIFTNKGIKQMDDFIDKGKDGPYLVDEYNVLGYKNLRSGYLIHNNGFVDTLKIEGIHGYIEGSLNHKIYAYKEGFGYDWFKLEELSEGDYISTQYGMNIWGNNDDVSDFIGHDRVKNIFKPKILNTDICYLLGLFIAEGSTYIKLNNRGDIIGGNITITCGDYIGDYIERAGLKYSCHDKIHYTISSKDLLLFLKYLGFDLTKKAKDKIIPKRLLEISSDNMKYLIRGIFDGDGYSRKDKGTIGIGLSSKILVEQIRIILNNFGILTDYYEFNSKPTKKVKVYSMNYRISCDTYFSKIYYDKIGFNFERKVKNHKYLRECKVIGSNDVIPHSYSLLKDIVKKSGISIRDFQKNNVKIKHIINTKKYKCDNLSRNLILNTIKVINDNGGDLNFDYINQNLKWFKIKKITKSKNYTYDFSLPNIGNDFWCHSVIYNGILGHQTPNGNDLLYWKTYNNAKLGKNTFIINEIKWYQDPRYNVNLMWTKDDETIENWNSSEWAELVRGGWKPTSPWYEGMKAEMDSPRKISQEIDGNFVGSGNTFVAGEDIDKQERECVINPIRIEGFDKSVWVFKEPEKDHRYAAGLDISLGQSDDWSVLTIVDFETWEQVFEWRGKMAPDVVAEFILKYLAMYGNPMLITDLTGGLGLISVNKLKEFGYKNFFYDYKGKDMYGYINKDELPAGLVIGSSITRMNVLDAFERNIRQGFKVRSQRTLSEMRTFIVTASGRPDHMKGCNDDCLFSLALALYLCEVRFKELSKNESQIKSLLNSWTVETTVTGVPTYNMQDRLNPLGGQPNQRQSQNEFGWLFGMK